jgi:hypothetical protein
MRRPLLAVLVCLALLAPMGAVRAALLGDASVPFSADRTVTVNGKSYSGRVFAVPGRQRHEQDLFGMREVFILDSAAARGWLVLPSVKTYVEFPFPAVMAELGAPDLRRAPEGQETIHGVRTTRYRIEHVASDGTRVTGHAWVSRTNVLMKFAVAVGKEGGRTTDVAMELSNLLEEAQDPGLFELPQGFVQLPGNALGPLMGGRGG